MLNKIISYYKHWRIKRAWIKALCSGEYKQGYGSLHSILDDSYCTLEVLCDLAVKDNVIKWEKDNNFYYIRSPDGKLLHRMGIPKQVKDWAGLKESNFSFSKITTMNDSRLYSFKEMANYIKKNIKVLA